MALLEVEWDTYFRRAHNRHCHGPDGSRGCPHNNSPLLDRRELLHNHDGMKGGRCLGGDEDPFQNFAWDILK